MLTMLLLLGAPLPRAMAAGSGRCYPPPCRVEAPQTAAAASAGASDPLQGVAPPRATTSSDRSPAPYIALGLAAICGLLTVVALRRRDEIVRRAERVNRQPHRLRAPAPHDYGEQRAVLRS